MASGADYVLVNDSTSLVEINGRVVRDFAVTLGPDKFDKLRAGYICINCWADFEGKDIGAFPEHCPEPYCGFPMRRNQQREFERIFGGIDTAWVALHKRADDAGVVLPNG